MYERLVEQLVEEVSNITKIVGSIPPEHVKSYWIKMNECKYLIASLVCPGVHDQPAATGGQAGAHVEGHAGAGDRL